MSMFVCAYTFRLQPIGFTTIRKCFVKLKDCLLPLELSQFRMWSQYSTGRVHALAHRIYLCVLGLCSPFCIYMSGVTRWSLFQNNIHTNRLVRLVTVRITDGLLCLIALLNHFKSNRIHSYIFICIVFVSVFYLFTSIFLCFRSGRSNCIIVRMQGAMSEYNVNFKCIAPSV